MNDPLDRLAEDRRLAREREDPCAGLCTLTNLGVDGWPDARTVVLRELEGRLAVFVNATSPKFSHLERVGLVVWLPTLNVQYRLRCLTEPVPQELIAESWQLRPEPPKHLDWFYTLGRHQSAPIESRDRLLDELGSLALPEPLTAPETARGLYLTPQLIERLDLGMENGIHDRRLYRRGNPGWSEEVLVP